MWTITEQFTRDDRRVVSHCEPAHALRLFEVLVKEQLDFHGLGYTVTLSDDNGEVITEFKIR